MKVLLSCLGVLILLTFISIFTGNDFMTISIEESYNYYITINGTTGDILFEGVGDLGLDPLIQAIIWISVIGLIGIISSISLFGSGFNEGGGRWMVGIIFFVAIWLMFSTFPLPLIMAIEGVGFFIYLFLTIIYAVDVIIFLMGGGD